MRLNVFLKGDLLTLKVTERVDNVLLNVSHLKLKSVIDPFLDIPFGKKTAFAFSNRHTAVTASPFKYSTFRRPPPLLRVTGLYSESLFCQFNQPTTAFRVREEAFWDFLSLELLSLEPSSLSYFDF